uniref:Collagen, type XIV, alpha 1b n=1 Tax=Xiphophorus couchianus TaxID=32473 RepID=A0A3B5MCY5_9TELE
MIVVFILGTQFYDVLIFLPVLCENVLCESGVLLLYSPSFPFVSVQSMDVQADVVLLVDGSYSIGLQNFAKVRAFLEVLVTSFDIGPNKIQISLVQYSRDPHTEFALNTHHDINAVVKAVRSFPYRGGSTNTGKAMTYVRERIFVPGRGARDNVPRVMVLITDGKSSDSFKDAAAKLRNIDVEIFAVGVKDAVRSELEAIANPPADTHVYEVEDFDAFQRISKELTQSICLLPPQDLRFSEITSRSFRATWTAPATAVLSYLVRFRKAEDITGDYVSLIVPGDTTTSILPHLFPVTTYEVNIFSQFDKGDSFPLTGEETTLEELSSPRDLVTKDVTDTSFAVSWKAAPGNVRQYRVTWKSLFSDETGEKTTQGDTTATVLDGLTPETRYQVSVFAVYGHGEASSKTIVVSDETEKTMKVTWQPAPGNVVNYRVTYKPQPGGRQLLRSIASDPDEIHMYNVADFSFLLDIVDNLNDNLCNSVKGGVYEFGSKHSIMQKCSLFECFEILLGYRHRL